MPISEAGKVMEDLEKEENKVTIGTANFLKRSIALRRETLAGMKKQHDTLDKAIPAVEAALERDIKRLIKLEK